MGHVAEEVSSWRLVSIDIHRGEGGGRRGEGGGEEVEKE
jgi:hypothetical protein